MHTAKLPLMGRPYSKSSSKGEGVREGVTVCDRGGVKSMWLHTYTFFIIHMKDEI